MFQKKNKKSFSFIEKLQIQDSFTKTIFYFLCILVYEQ